MTTYKVTGETPFLGHRPGEEFEAELGSDAERRAKERGSIRVLKRNHKPEDEQQEEEEENA